MSRRQRKRQPNRVTTPQRSYIEWIDSKSNPQFAALASFADIPQPRSMPKNYKSFALEGYRGNDTVFKCINYLIQNGAAIPPVLYTDRTMSKTIDSHPLLDKLARPNAEWSGVYFRKAVLGYYNVTGNAFLYAIRKGTSGPPDELWTLEPENVKIIPTATRGIQSYIYEPFGKDKPIDPRNIGHLKSWTPDDPLWGMSPIEVGALLVDQQTAAKKWNLALLQNMAKPPGAWVLAQVLSPNDRSKLKDALKEEMSGYRNAGTAPLLDGGLSWQAAGMAPSEMDWLESMKYNGGGLANLFNMPPQLIGDTSSTTYDNMEQAKAASYTEAIFPQSDEVYDLLNMWLVPMYPDLCDAKGQPVAYLYYDKTTVEVVQQLIQAQKTAKAQRAFQSWATGSASSMTLNEAREMQDLPPVDGGDVFRFGAVLVNSSELDKYAEQSLQKPAAPPMPVPENILDAPAPLQGENANDNKPDASGKPDTNGKSRLYRGDRSDVAAVDDLVSERDTALQKTAEKQTHWTDDTVESRLSDDYSQGIKGFTQAEKTALLALRSRLRAAKKLAPATHKTWECASGACTFCLQNDGVTVGIDEEFPNGCSTPDDCHRFCKCSEWELALPDDINSDDYSASFLIAAYAVRFIEGRHDRDVAEQEQQDEEDDTEEEKRRKRVDYKRFVEEVVLA